MLANNLHGTSGYICPILNARQEEVYSAIFQADSKNTKEIFSSSAININNLIEMFNNKYNDKEIFFIGEGLDKFKNKISKELKHRAVFSPAYYNLLRAGILCSISRKKLVKKTFSIKSNTIEPLYCSKYQINCAKKTYVI